MGKVKYLTEDKLEEIFRFLEPILNEDGIEFNPYFSYGEKEDINLFLASETSRNVYPLIWLLYPFKEIRSSNSLQAQSVRLILAVQNNRPMLAKQRLETSYKKALFPLFTQIESLLLKSANTEILEDEIVTTKFPNYGDLDQSESIHIWDALAIDFDLRINKFCTGLK